MLNNLHTTFQAPLLRSHKAHPPPTFEHFFLHSDHAVPHQSQLWPQVGGAAVNEQRVHQDDVSSSPYNLGGSALLSMVESLNSPGH